MSLTAAAAVSPVVPFAGDQQIPLVGLGTWKSAPAEVYHAVKYAILEAGYRHIDCAYVYQNEQEVGQALSEIISSGAVKREELFITSKLWSTFHSPDLVLPACKQTLANLQLDYLDLYLMHFPVGFREGQELKELFPIETSDVDYVDTWKGLEQVHAAGLTKSIGLSNFNSKQIDRVIAAAKVKPVCNQVESHPYLVQDKLITHCKERGITLVAYSPLGSPDRPWAQPGEPSLIQDEKIVQIANKYGKSPAQILIKFQAQRGIVVIPKSVSKERIRENISIFDFDLTDQELKTIASFDRSYRFVPFEPYKEHQYYPFKEEF
jgi:aldehyde reductase